MLSAVFVILFAGVLVGVLYATRELGTGFGAFLLGSFVVRLLLHFVTRNVAFFSHDLGGDALTYEYFAQWISEQWTIHGIKFMTAADNELIGATSLPPNLFATIVHLNGGERAPVACTALVALATCITALNFFRIAMELGAERRIASGIAIALFTSPALLFYTSDMYKDGIVLMLVLGATGSAIRVSRKFSLTHLVIGVVCLVALWFVRYYLVFLSVLPVLVGYMGFGSKGYWRPVLSVLAIGAFTAFIARGEQGDALRVTIDGTFTTATDKNVLDANATGGSGVALGGGIGSLPIRLVYTLFAPFPWTGGSMGLHLGKVDTLLLGFLLYRATLATRKLWRKDPSTLASLLAFVVPCTVAYAFTMANMGLMLRQRLPIVTVVALLAVLSWPSRQELARAAEARKKARAARAGSAPKGASVPPRRPALPAAKVPEGA